MQRLHHVAMKHAVFFLGRAQPACYGAPQQNGDADATHNQGQRRSKRLPSRAKRLQIRPSHSGISVSMLIPFVWIDSILRTQVDFGTKKMNLKRFLCKTRWRRGEAQANDCPHGHIHGIIDTGIPIHDLGDGFHASRLSASVAGVSRFCCPRSERLRIGIDPGKDCVDLDGE